MGCEDRPMPRRSGTTTVWSFASSAAIGDHMSPVLPKPWISTTAGPWPPTRTLIVASAFTTCELRKSAGKGVGAAWADSAPSARLAARRAATRRTRRENADETVVDMLGSLAAINSSGLVPFSPSNRPFASDHLPLMLALVPASTRQLAAKHVDAFVRR